MDIISVSIIIPTYNRSTTIEKTIESFIAQTYPHWEMLVVDDHSQDNTQDIITKYSTRDKRIHYLLNERTKGAQGARNTGIIHANNDWVCLFDSDDIVYPRFLEKLVDKINDNIDVVTCYAQSDNVKNNHKSLLTWGGEGNIMEELYDGQVYINFDNTLVRRQKLMDINLLDEDCPSFQEFDTHLRLSAICKYALVKEPLLDYISGLSDSMSTNNSKNIHGMCYVLAKHHLVWRKISPRHLKSLARGYYRGATSKDKHLLRSIVPELYLYLPKMYLSDIARFLFRKERTYSLLHPQK